MSLAAHLVEQHERKHTIIPRFQPPPDLHGHQQHHTSPSHSHSFGNRTMNGDTSWMSGHGQSFSFANTSANSNGFSRWSEERIASLQVRLARKLGPEYITQRPGPGGGPKLSYIEGWKVINLANEVFGFNGWSSSIVSLTTDFIDEKEGGRISCNITAIVRITLADGAWHEDVGCGQAENIRGKGAALDKAKKEAVTDATKRALRTFGNVLGNCLYDKDYTKEVVKIRVPPAKFQTSELERRAEFTDAGAPGPSRQPANPQPMPQVVHNPPRTHPPHPPAPVAEPEPARPSTPLRSIEDLPEDFLMSDSFDAEYLPTDESFFQGIDQAGASSTLKQEMEPVQEQAPPVPAAPAAPAYQHRHRPDAPQNQQRDAQAGSAARHAALMGMQAPAAPDEKLQRSGGDMAAIEAPQPRGGFAYPDQTDQQHQPRASTSSTAGQSARALAISSAMGRPQNAPPPRVESPKIPSGGVDNLAARATNQYAARASALGINDDTAIENKSGFASARGVKRVVSGGQVSPIKNQGPPYNVEGRQALAELGGQEDSSKRMRQ